MAKNLQRNPTTTNLARLNGKDFDCTLGLENYVTRRSMCFFDLIEANEQKKAKSFLSQPPSTYLTDKNYTEMKLTVHELKVVKRYSTKRCCSHAVATDKKINALQKLRNGYKRYKYANAIAIIRKTKNKFLNTSDGLNELSHVKYLLVGWKTAWRWAATTWSKYRSCSSSRVRLPLYAWMRATPLCAVSFYYFQLMHS